MTGSAEEAKPEGQLVRTAHERGITTLTLDSPHNRNALSKGLVSQLYAGLERAAGDPRVRAVLLTHTGGTFCAGADLREGSGSPGDLAALLRTVVELPKPVVARVDGHVRAGGTGLLGACDISVAGPSSTFAFTEARIGVAPAVISMPLLPRLDARAAARYYLTGERFGAAEAARIGLVTLAAGDGGEGSGTEGNGADGTDAATAVDDALQPLLDGLRKGSPQGLAESKRLVTAEVLRAFDRDTDSLAELSARLFASDEAREGMTAFLERREPAWVEQ
ncbi:enoyl-CoA hydratase family protein [Streptomyces sp. WMMB 322]|uniref:enoyl-CoA hydratase family protein n=1 Tax=Streptomyces sp. WMMB 322 TaxID=1286821 RepID=UPI00082377A5|nr:enoyl-CoA hydratase family protein [Streptomyces sp. WMMB 322]SCK07503.1 enoyl-CoA hydratase [Streptomyces sp. WMMB 322]